MPDKALDIEPEKKPEDPDAALLKEIRDDFKHFLDYWRENREEMEIDMRFAGADAFSPDEHEARKGRPTETPDELSQYVKQTNNNLRQNKRDVNISPASEDASGEDAEKREAVLRGLNHRGNFQACFQTGFECSTWSGMGAFGIAIRKDQKTGIVEPRPRRFPNQFAILLDPYAKEADYSDQKKCFVIDRMRQSDFVLEFPDATKRSFSTDDAKTAPEWIQGQEIIVAEFWKVEKGGKVMQYITNGVEILDRVPWPGSWIPIIPILGEEIYVTEGGRQKRKYLSLIRRARVPQKMLAYIASQELEEFGMAPRVPFVGYEGQFTDPNWQTVNTSPVPFLTVPQIADPTDPNKTLPIPTRPQFQPNSSAYEMAREAWRRSVQSAIGITPLPTSAQRQNEKSGVALEKIQNQEATGSYHFVDNADRALVNYGRQMNELIDKGTTAGRHVGTKLKDDTHGILYLAKPGEQTTFEPESVLEVGKGDYDVTLTVGPNKESEREDASDFVDTLLQNMKGLPIPPPIGTKILSLAIKLKNVGPLGDEIAKLLDPEQGDPQQQLQQMMAQAQQQQQAMQEMQTELQKLQLEKQGKVIDNEYKLKLEAMRSATDTALTQLTNDIKVLVALITAKRGEADQEAEMYKTFWLENHKAAHELGMQKDQQAHESNMAQTQAAIASAQSAQDSSQDQAAAERQAALNPPQETGQ